RRGRPEPGARPGRLGRLDRGSEPADPLRRCSPRRRRRLVRPEGGAGRRLRADRPHERPPALGQGHPRPPTTRGRPPAAPPPPPAAPPPRRPRAPPAPPPRRSPARSPRGPTPRGP